MATDFVGNSWLMDRFDAALEKFSTTAAYHYLEQANASVVNSLENIAANLASIPRDVNNAFAVASGVSSFEEGFPHEAWLISQWRDNPREMFRTGAQSITPQSVAKNLALALMAVGTAGAGTAVESVVVGASAKVGAQTFASSGSLVPSFAGAGSLGMATTELTATAGVIAGGVIVAAGCPREPQKPPDGSTKPTDGGDAGRDAADGANGEDRVDSGPTDSGDAGGADAADASDGGLTDSGPADSGLSDGGPADSGPPIDAGDGGPADASDGGPIIDAGDGGADASEPDAGGIDASDDAGPDAGPDAGYDAGSDAGDGGPDAGLDAGYILPSGVTEIATFQGQVREIAMRTETSIWVYTKKPIQLFNCNLVCNAGSECYCGPANCQRIGINADALSSVFDDDMIGVDFIPTPYGAFLSAEDPETGAPIGLAHINANASNPNSAFIEGDHFDRINMTSGGGDMFFSVAYSGEMATSVLYNPQPPALPIYGLFMPVRDGLVQAYSFGPNSPLASHMPGFADGFDIFGIRTTTLRIDGINKTTLVVPNAGAVDPDDEYEANISILDPNDPELKPLKPGIQLGDVKLAPFFDLDHTGKIAYLHVDTPAPRELIVNLENGAATNIPSGASIEGPVAGLEATAFNVYLTDVEGNITALNLSTGMIDGFVKLPIPSVSPLHLGSCLFVGRGNKLTVVDPSILQ